MITMFIFISITLDLDTSNLNSLNEVLCINNQIGCG